MLGHWRVYFLKNDLVLMNIFETDIKYRLSDVLPCILIFLKESPTISPKPTEQKQVEPSHHIDKLETTRAICRDLLPSLSTQTLLDMDYISPQNF